MPVNPTGATGAPRYDGDFWVTAANGVEFKISPYTDVSTGPDSEAAVQSLINHLQGWPDLAANFTVTSAKSESVTYAITPDE